MPKDDFFNYDYEINTKLKRLKVFWFLNIITCMIITYFWIGELIIQLFLNWKIKELLWDNSLSSFLIFLFVDSAYCHRLCWSTMKIIKLKIIIYHIIYKAKLLLWSIFQVSPIANINPSFVSKFFTYIYNRFWFNIYR